MKSIQPAAGLDGEASLSPELVINQVLKQETLFLRKHLSSTYYGLGTALSPWDILMSLVNDPLELTLEWET